MERVSNSLLMVGVLGCMSTNLLGQQIMQPTVQSESSRPTIQSPFDPTAEGALQTESTSAAGGNEGLVESTVSIPAWMPENSKPSRLQLSGNLSLVGLAGTSRAFVPWNPLFMLPASPFDLPTNTLEMHARQSSIQGLLLGPRVGDYSTSGRFRVYLLADSLTSDTYGLLPVIAFGEMRNEHWRLSAGLQPDLFAPRDPVVIPSVLLGGSGNPGTFRGQLRLERYLWSDSASAGTLQFALSDPLTTILIDSSRRTTESNGWPNIETRLLFGIGPEATFAGGRSERNAELAVAGVVGQLRSTRLAFDIEDLVDPSTARELIDVWGLSVDGKWNMTHRLGVAGEFFTGQAIGNYAANIFQSFNPDTFEPIRGSGGWGEIFFYVTDRLHIHSGYGIESPQRSALSTTSGISRNETWYTNWVWDFDKSIQLSFEVDYRETRFVSLERGSGVLFISQFLWRF